MIFREKLTVFSFLPYFLDKSSQKMPKNRFHTILAFRTSDHIWWPTKHLEGQKMFSKLNLGLISASFPSGHACLRGAWNSRGDSSVRKHEVRASTVENWSTALQKRRFCSCSLLLSITRNFPISRSFPLIYGSYGGATRGDFKIYRQLG